MERRSSLAKEQQVQAQANSNVKRREESASDKLAAIQSIANVLNHHAQQLTRYEQDDDDDEQVETRQVSTLATQQESEATARAKPQVDQLAGRPSLTLFASDGDDEFAPSQSIKVTADKWPPEQSSKGSGSGQQLQQQRRPAGKLKRQSSARARAADQQYLYAYNSAAVEQTSADLLAHETNTKNPNPANRQHATRATRLTGLRKAEQEEDGERSNEDDTLSCCVERSARQEGDLLLFAAHEQLISGTGNSKADNLNHLRAYLQIEENFNSYRAAKQRHIHQAGASSSSAAPARKLDPHHHQHHHLHLPLANYIIATNEQRLPAGEESAQNVAHGQQPSATSSSTSCTSLNQQQQLINQQQEPPITTNHQNYLEILKFAVTPTKTKLAGAASKLISKSGTSGAMGNFKMYSSEQPNLHHAHAQQQQQQLVVGSLAGQPGAYYVMGGSQQSSSDGSDESTGHHVNSDNLQTPSGHLLVGAHQHHLHHSHLHHPHHTHHLNQQHQQQHYHHTHHYQAQPLGASASASDSSLGSSGAFASSAMRATSGWLRDFCSKKCLFVACLLLIMFIFILVISLTAYLNFLITTSKTNLQPLSGRLRVDMAPQELWPGGGSEIMGAAQANKSSAEFLARQRDFETIIRGALDRTQATLKSYPNHLVKLEVYSIMKLPNLIVTSGGGALSGLWVHFRLFLNKRTLQHDAQLMRRKSPDEQFERQFLPRLTQQTLHSGFEQLLASSGRLITSPGSDQLTSEAATQPLGINSRRFGAGSTSAQIDSTQTTRRLATRATPSAQSTASTQTARASSQMLKSFDEQMNRLMHLIEAIDLQSILVTPEFDMTQTMAASPGATSGALQVMSETLRASQPMITSTQTPANVTTATQPVTRAPEVSSTTTTKFTLGPNYRENSTRPSSSAARESPFLLNQKKVAVTTTTTTTTTTTPVRLVEGRPVIASQPPVVTQQVNRKLIKSTTTTVRPVTRSPVLVSSTSPASIEALWTNTLNNQNVSTLELSSTSSTTTTASTTPSDSTRRRVITVTSSENAKAPVSASSSDWQRVASSETMAPVNASWQQQVTSSTSAPQTSSSTSTTRAPKVSPHLNFAGSLIAATNSRADNSNARRAQKAQESAVILRDANQANQTPSGQVSTATTTSGISSNITSAPTVSSTTTRRPKQKQKQKQQQARAQPAARNGTSSSVVKLTTAKPAKAKKVALSSSTSSLDNSTSITTTNSNSTTLKGIRIVDDFLATQSNKPATTLPTTTIELTRSSTSGQPAARTTPMSVTTAPPTATTTQSANDFVVSNQQARPGTTSFSGQWRPIADTDFWSSAAPAARVNRTSGGRSPSSGSNLSLIVATERLPPTLNQAHGSQSPFAMPSRSQQPSTSGFANRFRAPANDFESHRVSRMRQSQAHAQRSNESGDQFGGSASSSTMSSSSTSSSTTTTTTTSSSLNFGDPNTRIVDDFMITADPNEGASGRGATLIPPLVMSTLHRPEVASETAAALAAKRTRGPFAFETLRSLAFETPPPPINTLDPLDFEPTAASTRAERSPEVQQRAVTDEKLLVRKQLFLDEPEVSRSRADFGNRKWRRSSQACPHFGCRARDSQEFVCLNRTQICDDFTDCMDSSDELDCVSLLKLDPSTSSMRFSNGAGIVYLNRRGALAPMCIDHYHPHLSPSDGSGSGHTDASVAQSRATHSAHELEAVQLRAAMRRQNELIRQINTIGQYACSLQSFSRLVSVKINHHDQVDGLDLIKSAGLFHTLTISDSLSGNGSSSSSSSFKSAGYEVEIGSSSECPSQRTVFVKCGAFECGQDSFSVPATSRQGDHQQQTSSTIVSDFPWLVKLYLNDALACQGYLIDESWLLAARACLANNKSLLADNNWTAEISHEHYDDMTRRRVKDIHVPAASRVGNHARDGSAIVLAKLERPVRFSPLNRPICLPLASAINNNNQNNSSLVESDNNYTDCISLTLPLNYNNNKPVRNLNLDSTSPPTHSNTSPPTHLVFNKVKLIRAEECLNENWQTVTPSGGDLVCAIDEEINQTNNNNDADDHEENTTRVLICAPKQRTSTGNNRSRWTVVGVQSTTTLPDATLKPKRRLYARVSSQLDWIVDTMNPKSNDTHSNPIEGGESFELMIANSNQTHTTRQAATLNELNPFDSLNQAHHQRQQPDGTCTSFKCSTGECLSWSRICDGLYDCSSHDDERDCHR